MNRMLKTTLSQALLVAVVGSVALVGCKKNEEAAAPTPPAAQTAPTPPPPAPAATASIAAVDIGTATSDPAATVAGKVGAKLVYLDKSGEMVVSDETRDLNLSNTGNTSFQFAKPDGWPAGKYRIDISLDGKVVQSKEFDVAK